MVVKLSRTENLTKAEVELDIAFATIEKWARVLRDELPHGYQGKLAEENTATEKMLQAAISKKTLKEMR